jgi:hypothetical protein
MLILMTTKLSLLTVLRGLRDVLDGLTRRNHAT